MNTLTLKISLTDRQARLFHGLAHISGMNRRQFAKFGLVTFLESEQAANIFDSLLNDEDIRTRKTSPGAKPARKETKP